MKTIGIIAEFNPFHNGHKYLIDKCKKDLGADRVVIVMSGNYVQRGAPSIIDKFSRAGAAVSLGADLVLELPLYYSLGSAEFFAMGAVTLLNNLGCVDYLCFGSEFPDTDKLLQIAGIVFDEPRAYKDELSEALKRGEAFPAARAKGLIAQLRQDKSFSNPEEYLEMFSSPNCILAIEYLRSLKKTGSTIKPYIIQRVGHAYHSQEFGSIPSAAGIRARLLAGSCDRVRLNAPFILEGVMPREGIESISGYEGRFVQSNDFSSLMHYKLLLEQCDGYSYYLDVNKDISNRIINSLDYADSFSGLCTKLKSKNLVYTRISRCLFHILLNITEDNMSEYKADGFTNYARVLSFNQQHSDLLKVIHEKSSVPVLDRPKDADKLLNPLQKRLFDETMNASLIYNSIACNGIISEYRRRFTN
jgi:predicted nucleotidyltransferase